MTKTRIILTVILSGCKSTFLGRRINPKLLHFIPVLQYGLHSLRIRKWQMHGRNYIVLLICWGAHYRKPRVAWKTASTACWACRGGNQRLAVLGKHREGVSSPRVSLETPLCTLPYLDPPLPPMLSQSLQAGLSTRSQCETHPEGKEKGTGRNSHWLRTAMWLSFSRC